VANHNSPNVNQTLSVLLNHYNFETVLDIGCGKCIHTDYFKSKNKKVTSTDYFKTREDVISGDYMSLQFEEHDAVWCSHVLEHQFNVDLFLRKLVSECKEGGTIALTVPPLKHEIVGGHLSLWNAGLLIYRLILTGLDCSKARVGTYGYNISVVTEKISIQLPDLKHGNGDLETLSKYFPIKVKQGFNGQKINHNWEV